MLIFSPHKMKYVLYLQKKVNFLFILYFTENTKSVCPGGFLFDLTFSVCLLCITLGVS